MLEMYRRDQFQQDLLVEQCLEVIAIEERLREIDELLAATVAARRAGRRRPLHLRRADRLGLALLRATAAGPVGARARRRLPELRHRAAGRRAVLRELRHARPGAARQAGNAQQDDGEQTMYEQQAERSGDPWEG